jgi:hypothetical protein
MEHQVGRYFFATLGFALALVWAGLGATDAILALTLCIAGLHVHRLRVWVERAQARSHADRRPQRTRLNARPLRDEDERPYQMVPDDPSLIITPS